jgi:hypothetical protein
LPGYIQETALIDSLLVLARYEDGTLALHSWHGRVPSSFSPGTLPDLNRTIGRVLDPTANPLGHLVYVPNRIAQMVDAGFGLEALALLNSYIEYFVRVGLQSAVGHINVAVAKLDDLNLSRLLELLERLATRGFEQALSLPQFLEFLQVADEVRKFRNSYTHQLELPDNELWQTTNVDRRIVRLTSLFTDPFWRDTRFGLIGNLFHARSETRAFLIDELVPRSPISKLLRLLPFWLRKLLTVHKIGRTS